MEHVAWTTSPRWTSVAAASRTCFLSLLLALLDGSKITSAVFSKPAEEEQQEMTEQTVTGTTASTSAAEDEEHRRLHRGPTFSAVLIHPDGGNYNRNEDDEDQITFGADEDVEDVDGDGTTYAPTVGGTNSRWRGSSSWEQGSSSSRSSSQLLQVGKGEESTAADSTTALLPAAFLAGDAKPRLLLEKICGPDTSCANVEERLAEFYGAESVARLKKLTLSDLLQAAPVSVASYAAPYVLPAEMKNHHKPTVVPCAETFPGLFQQELEKNIYSEQFFREKEKGQNVLLADPLTETIVPTFVENYFEKIHLSVKIPILFSYLEYYFEKTAPEATSVALGACAESSPGQPPQGCVRLLEANSCFELVRIFEDSGPVLLSTFHQFGVKVNHGRSLWKYTNVVNREFRGQEVTPSPLDVVQSTLAARLGQLHEKVQPTSRTGAPAPRYKQSDKKDEDGCLMYEDYDYRLYIPQGATRSGALSESGTASDADTSAGAIFGRLYHTEVTFQSLFEDCVVEETSDNTFVVNLQELITGKKSHKDQRPLRISDLASAFGESFHLIQQQPEEGAAGGDETARTSPRPTDGPRGEVTEATSSSSFLVQSQRRSGYMHYFFDHDHDLLGGDRMPDGGDGSWESSVVLPPEHLVLKMLRPGVFREKLRAERAYLHELFAVEEQEQDQRQNLLQKGLYLPEILGVPSQIAEANHLKTTKRREHVISEARTRYGQAVFVLANGFRSFRDAVGVLLRLRMKSERAVLQQMRFALRVRTPWHKGQSLEYDFQMPFPHLATLDAAAERQGKALKMFSSNPLAVEASGAGVEPPTELDHFGAELTGAMRKVRKPRTKQEILEAGGRIQLDDRYYDPIVSVLRSHYSQLLVRPPDEDAESLDDDHGEHQTVDGSEFLTYARISDPSALDETGSGTVEDGASVPRAAVVHQNQQTAMMARFSLASNPNLVESTRSAAAGFGAQRVYHRLRIRFYSSAVHAFTQAFRLWIHEACPGREMKDKAGAFHGRPDLSNLLFHFYEDSGATPASRGSNKKMWAAHSDTNSKPTKKRVVSVTFADPEIYWRNKRKPAPVSRSGSSASSLVASSEGTKEKLQDDDRKTQQEVVKARRLKQSILSRFFGKFSSKSADLHNDLLCAKTHALKQAALLGAFEDPVPDLASARPIDVSDADDSRLRIWAENVEHVVGIYFKLRNDVDEQGKGNKKKSHFVCDERLQTKIMNEYFDVGKAAITTWASEHSQEKQSHLLTYSFALQNRINLKNELEQRVFRDVFQKVILEYFHCFDFDEANFYPFLFALWQWFDGLEELKTRLQAILPLNEFLQVFNLKEEEVVEADLRQQGGTSTSALAVSSGSYNKKRFQKEGVASTTSSASSGRTTNIENAYGAEQDQLPKTDPLPPSSPPMELLMRYLMKQATGQVLGRAIENSNVFKQTYLTDPQQKELLQYKYFSVVFAEKLRNDKEDAKLKSDDGDTSARRWSNFLRSSPTTTNAGTSRSNGARSSGWDRFNMALANARTWVAR
ncbi:unnamed protein product [Amoebophrya sp. A120]|nr:unnamed protein product [Amoebophrya sp. A120]|eukprot:GSA120T00012586001.1